MTLYEYKYSKDSDFSIAPDKINLSSLVTEVQEAIEQGKINVVYDHIGGALTDGYVTFHFRGKLSTQEQVELRTVCLNHDGGEYEAYDQVRLAEQKDSVGRLVTVPDVRLGSEVVLATHNFADPCSWYAESLRTSEALSMKDAEGYQFEGTYQNWIDLSNGRVLREDKITAAVDHGYKVKITVDGYELEEQTVTSVDPDSADYKVHYEDGYVEFLNESYLGKTVQAEYSFSYGSGWYLIPFEGKEVRIERAEVQFSEDVGFHDAIDMIIYIGDPTANPETWIEYKKASYKCMDNFIDEAEGAFPLIPPLPGRGGTKKNRYGFPFRYSTARPLSYSHGVFLCVKMRNHRAFDGERATATFYCTIVDE
jgi:hypothetical protein